MRQLRAPCRCFQGPLFERPQPLVEISSRLAGVRHARKLRTAAHKTRPPFVESRKAPDRQAVDFAKITPVGLTVLAGAAPSRVVNRFASTFRHERGIGCELKNCRSWPLSPCACEKLRSSTDGYLCGDSGGARNRVSSGVGPIPQNAGRVRDLAPPDLLRPPEDLKVPDYLLRAGHTARLFEIIRQRNDFTPQSRTTIADRCGAECEWGGYCRERKRRR